jgi:PAS domain S-box-containing protein
MSVGGGDVGELFDTLPCGIVSFTDDGVVTLANATLRRMLGYDAGELEGRHVERMLTVAGRIFYQTHLYPLLRLHGHADEIFLLLRRKDGGQVGALANTVRTQRGGLQVNDCVLIETRERRKYEDALLGARRDAEAAHAALLARTREMEQAREAAEEANRAKTQFLTTMSHELRTPLNAIGGYAQLMEIGVHGALTDGQRDALARITRSQRHLLRLINEVLNLARIESGHVDYEVEDVSIAAAVAAVVPMVEPQMGAGDLSFHSAIPDGLTARADRDKVQQILINLLTNAVKFTPAGGSVRIDAHADDAGRRLFVRVTDTGIGIPADKIAGVFDPFVQVNTGLVRTAEGTGLGLAISRDLARGMQGELSAESALGRGSTFTLTLPRAERRDAAPG